MIATFSIAHIVVLVVVLALLVGVVWALVVTISDPRMKTADKVGWAAALIILPVLGLFVWFIVRMATRQRRNPGAAG